MLTFLQSVDENLFRFINGSLSNPIFDQVMPFLSENPFFYPVLLAVAVLLIIKGGTRGRICAAMLLLVIAIGDGVICKTLKETIGRPRPFNLLPEGNLLVGKGGSGSMPSSHAANWFAGMTVAFLFYRRSWRFMLPLAFLVSFSRIYNGVHYPGDVLVGALLGIGYGAGIVLGLDWLWRIVGPRWFPLWWAALPSLLPREAVAGYPLSVETRSATLDQHWLRLGYLFVFVLLTVRLFYLASGKIQLSEDEAYQWLWSKHLALSYFSKPLMIAFLQYFGTSLFGDTELGVRFFSPVIAAAMALLILRFVSRETNGRVGFISIVVISTAPLLAVGSTLMTIDPPLVLFWTAAMFTGWRALAITRQSSPTSDPADAKRSTLLWCLAGLFLGLSFLSKYAAFFQIICWGLFFVLWKPARIHLRKPGPYLALLIFALCTLPVIIWNQQNGWITAHHVADNAGREDAWKPTLRYFWEFVGQQAALLNPVFFLGMVWAMFAFWRSERRNPLLLFFFCMGAPVFLGYAMFTGYKRVFPNWIAPSIVPLFLLMIIYWYQRWQGGVKWIKSALLTGIAIGAVMIVFVHDTNLLAKVAKRMLPPAKDPLRRVRAWDVTAEAVGAERKKLLSEGMPVFIIGNHYGLVGQISFYLPEGRAAVQEKGMPLVYYMSSEKPQNQIFFWPEYRYRTHRKGENAIFVQDLDLKNPIPWPVPAALQKEFRSVEDLGTREIRYRDGRIFRVIQVFACRDLQ